MISAAPMRRFRTSGNRSSRVTDWLDWPFFEPRHRELAERLEDWCRATIHDAHPSDADYACRALVSELGKAGFLKLCVADKGQAPDVRSLAIARATLARVHGLADFAFAMQGLGSGAISLAGSEAQRAEWLTKVASGNAIAAYALTEPETGSDAAYIAMTARQDGGGCVLDGEKSYISNG